MSLINQWIPFLEAILQQQMVTYRSQYSQVVSHPAKWQMGQSVLSIGGG